MHLLCVHASVATVVSSRKPVVFCLAACVQWDVQAVIVRINASLLVRGYKVWFDLDMMKGSTLDAMSEAVEGAELMLFGVSEKCECE